MAKYEEVSVHGYEEFSKAVSERKGKDIFAYFSGNKDGQGKSWCPDCVKGKFKQTYILLGNRNDICYISFFSSCITAEPVVRGQMSHLPEGSVFIYCQVGDRP